MDDRVREALSKGGIIDITTTGRRSGLPHRVEIVFQNIDGRLYISGLPREQKRHWLANLEADPRFTFHLKREARYLPPGVAAPGDVEADLPAVARPITDERERRSVLHHMARAWSRDDIDEMVRHSPLIEVTIEDA